MSGAPGLQDRNITTFSSGGLLARNTLYNLIGQGAPMLVALFAIPLLINIEFTGIRPGEKLFEELLTAEEGSCATRHKRIYVAKPTLVEVSALDAELVRLLRKGLQCTAEDVFDALSVIVPDFKRYRQERVG